MLEYYVRSPRCRERMRIGPLAEHIDALAVKLHSQGFTRLTGQRYLGLTGELNELASEWVSKRRRASISGWSSASSARSCDPVAPSKLRRVGCGISWSIFAT